jgi:lytic murein transglycosylase
LTAFRDALAKGRCALPFLVLMLVILVSGPATSEDKAAPSAADFKEFLIGLWPEAEARGITRSTFDSAFQNIALEPRVMALVRVQPEYGKPFGDYVNSFASPGRIDNGLRKVTQWAEVLDNVERRYGVDRNIIVAIWGLETSYGAEPLRYNVISALATFAQARYREPFFRNELLAALKILQDGHLPPERMLGSWAGALGQPQFMPSSFSKFAASYAGTGSPDIWTNIPDVLASIGNYFRLQGWQPGLAWGFEVNVPAGFDYRRSRASFLQWAELGVKRADGLDFPARGEAILFFPSGSTGPAFLVTDNFIVIKRYNNSDSYALAAGYLADRLRGGGPFRAAWPKDDRQLTLPERIALQRKLAELGFRVNDFQGRFDFDLRDNIRELQAKFGMVPDGAPTVTLLDALGVVRRP